MFKNKIKNNNLTTILTLTNYKSFIKVKKDTILLKTAFLFYVCLT